MVVSVPEEETSTSLVKEDTLNKALSTPAFLVQKFAQFEAFPKLIVTRMTSRNLLIDAVSALRFACLCQKLSSFGNGCLFLVGVQQVLRSKSVRLTQVMCRKPARLA